MATASSTHGFEVFWAAYPRKVCKKDAAAAWRKIGPDATLAETIVSAVYAQRLADRALRYIPYPATWLNREQWTDEVVTESIDRAPRVLTKAQLRSERNAAAAAAVIASFEAEAE